MFGNSSPKIGEKHKAAKIEAETSIPNLNNWNDIYLSYRKFNNLDDGAIAEAYSDVIVKMFADHWSELKLFIKIISKDQKFYSFALKHIDATADVADLEKVMNNSSKHCRKSMQNVYSDIYRMAKKAIRDADQQND